MRIAVIIPALNEEEAIGIVVREVPRHLVSEILVVDNGSSDRTVEVARAAGARVIREPMRGYGAACLAGAAAVEDADILVFLDGDRSDDPAELPAILQPVLEGRADLTIGARVPDRTQAGGLSLQQRIGNRVVTWLLRLLFGVSLTDIGSFRAIRADTFRILGMEHKTYGWPAEMIIKVAMNGHRVVSVPISYRKRIGRSKVGGTLKGSLLAGYHLLSTTLRYAWKRQRAGSLPARPSPRG